jgi:hypothetical protein
VSRLYLQWHEVYFAETADRIWRAVRAANPNCVIYVASHDMKSREDAVSLWLAAPEHSILHDPAITGQEKTAWRNPAGPPPARGWLELVAGWTAVTATNGGQALVLMSTNENKATASPGLVVSSYGDGRVVYLPAELDQAMFFYPNTYISAMLVNAMRWVAQDAPPPVEVDGPLLLGTRFRRQRIQQRVVVHLLNDQSSYGRHSNYQNMLVKKAATAFSKTRLS